nr:MAG TPA: hypothetical protein [Caudoviricetes sp.]
MVASSMYYLLPSIRLTAYHLRLPVFPSCQPLALAA